VGLRHVPSREQQQQDGFARFDGSTWSPVGGENAMPAPACSEAFDDGGAAARACLRNTGGGIEVFQGGTWSPLIDGQGANDRIESLVTLSGPANDRCCSRPVDSRRSARQAPT
jgi:hypothetical protein